MKYADLNLKTVREACGLDFAHFTYKKGQCTCCYGPKDMAARYWKNGVIREDNDFTYILYKNADNCFPSGRVKKTDDIHTTDYLSWRMPMEMLPKVCQELSKQYPSDYLVVEPDTAWECISILQVSRWSEVLEPSAIWWQGEMFVSVSDIPGYSAE